MNILPLRGLGRSSSSPGCQGPNDILRDCIARGTFCFIITFTWERGKCQLIHIHIYRTTNKTTWDLTGKSLWRWPQNSQTEAFPFSQRKAGKIYSLPATPCQLTHLYFLWWDRRQNNIRLWESRAAVWDQIFCRRDILQIGFLVCKGRKTFTIYTARNC